MKSILLFVCLFFVHVCVSQTAPQLVYTPYQTGTIPGLAKFRQGNKYVYNQDTMYRSHNDKMLEFATSGTGFLKGTPQEIIDRVVHDRKIMSGIYFKDNRSQYRFTRYKNGIAEPPGDGIEEFEQIGTQCDCVLNGDTIRVEMGVWAFGGFGFSLTFKGKQFAGSYWEDMHKLKVFLVSPGDTALTGGIRVGLKEPKLVLLESPKYQLGQQLTGHLIFQTADYFRSVDYKDGIAFNVYNNTKTDILFTKGYFHFTCKVRERVENDR
jgi:hypothetical protein